ncbi:hypothetical protein VKT23_019922 [Stygiomarasmius scandens]|uniref:F-box domain-containing protein n=1 Tax=Marasmiellus scandens TaxID=2682957 RepID=A0ABR1IN88_9AGAR
MSTQAPDRGPEPFKKSDILESLRSNFGTYNYDTKHVAQCLFDAEHNAKCYEDEINRLEANLVSLRNEQQRIFLRIDQYRSLLAPIRRLPPEILGGIFEICCLESKIADAMDCPVIRLSQVCAGWRKLSRSTSSLWAHITVKLDRSESSEDKIQSMLGLHLSLSGRSPLHLKLFLPYNTNTARKVIDSVVPHSRRWETIVIDAPFGMMIEPNFTRVKGNLPSLRYLELWPPTDEEDDIQTPETTTIFDAFDHAAKLQTLKLGSLDDVDNADVRITWSQINDFTLSYSGFRDTIKRVGLAHQAREVTVLHPHTLTPDEVDGDTSLLVHHMTQLSFCLDKYDTDMSCYFDRLTLPKLKTLRLFTDDDCLLPKGRYGLDRIPSLILRSKCNITSLELVNLVLDDEQIVIHLLREITSLSDLTIHERRIDDDSEKITLTTRFLQQLTINHRASTSLSFLPHLKYIDFRVRQPFDASVFVHAVQSRWIPTPEHASEMGVECLKGVRLQIVGQMEKELVDKLKPLQALRAAGLQFSFTSCDAVLASE